MTEDIRKIREAIENNKLVVFVGAGVSVSAGLPTWGELIQEYKKRLDLSDEDKSLPESFLKIPQYYYNKRGFKDYYDVLYSVFNKSCTPNNLHTLIYKLSPQHIITTNYDNLLEQERDRLGLLYDVVSEDKDLPYTPNGRLIIKMHGDLNKKNIVLKEEDYLSYSKEFSMIETYVKALFTNHTIMFVGYGVDDYNLKLIINNVKDVLGKHFQRGYILNSEEKLASRYEKDYFEKIGFNIIQKDVIEEEFWKEKEYQERNQRTKNLQGLLEYINEGYKIQDKESILKYYSEVLSVFEDFNYISITDLIKILDCKYMDIGKNQVTLVLEETNNNLEKLINRILEINKYLNQTKIERESNRIQINNNELKYYDKINKVFEKADIKVVKFRLRDSKGYMNQIDLEFRQAPYKFTLNLENKLLECASGKIIRFCLREDGLYTDGSTLYMKEITDAYIDYVDKKYLTSYKKLKSILERAYRDKKYLICYIVEYNRIQLIKILERINKGFYNAIGETIIKYELEEYIQEYKSNKINLEDIYRRLSKAQKNNLPELKLFQFDNELIYRKQNKLTDLRKAQKKKYQESTIAPVSTTIIDTIRYEVYGLWYMTNLNHFMISHYSEVKKFYLEYLEMLCNSYKEGGNLREDSFWGGPTQYDIDIREVELNILDFNIIIKNILSKDLNRLCNEYEIKYLKSNIEAEQLEKIFKNLIEQYSAKDSKQVVMSNLQTFINLLAYIRLDDKKMDCIMRNLVILIDRNVITEDIYESITYFVLLQKNIHLNKEKLRELSTKILISYMKKISNAQYNNKQGGGEITVLERWNLIHILVNNIDTNDNTDIQKSFEDLIENLKCYKMYNMEQLIIKSLLIKLYKCLNYEHQQLVSDLIKTSLEKHFNPSIYTQGLSWDIFEPIQEFEVCFFEYIEKERQGKVKGVISEPDNLRKYLIKAVILNQKGKILDLERLKQYKGIYNIVDLLMCPEEFDYENKFESKWLGEIGEEELQKLLEYPNVKEKIKAKLKTEIDSIVMNKYMVTGIKALL